MSCIVLAIYHGGQCMAQLKAKKPFEELTFSDDFIFCHVLENNPDLCRKLVEVILGRHIGKIQGIKKQHTIDTAYDVRGVRFDIHFSDETSKIYSVEMQTYNERDLSKRCRFYLSSMDQEQLDKGSHISGLKDTYIIFICTYNIAVQHNLARYTFERTCSEIPEYKLEDGTHLIIVCAENGDENVSDELKNLLSYIADGEASDMLTTRLEEHVSIGRKSKEWRREYMLMAEYLDEAKAEGIEEEKKRTVLNMLHEGFDINVIARIADVSLDYVQRLYDQKVKT